MAEGVNENGLTLTGFLFLHALFIERGRLETMWTVLRKYGYDDEIKLRDDLLLSPPFKRMPDQSVELTEKAVEFLKRVFTSFDIDGEPQKSLAHLIYIGYPGDLTLAFRITQQQKQDRRKQRSQRVVLQCFVFGPTNVGKSALLNALIGRLYNEAYEHTKGDHYATNIVEQIGGSKKTLVMRDINEEPVSSLLEKRDALADCDVAAFVYDGSNAASWKRIVDLLVEVAAHGEKYGFEVPCLLVAAKDDLEPDPICHQSSIQVCADMGVEASFTVSMKLGDIGNLFRRIVDAAQ
ncbi:unnamed protein product [Sphagnum balticum]